jgi:superfamily II DNA helicase RecQ
MVLVVSPLLSLIQDQLLQLPSGLKGATLNSTLTPLQV